MHIRAIHIHSRASVEEPKTREPVFESLVAGAISKVTGKVLVLQASRCAGRKPETVSFHWIATVYVEERAQLNGAEVLNTRCQKGNGIFVDPRYRHLVDGIDHLVNRLLIFCKRIGAISQPPVIRMRSRRICPNYIFF